MKQRLNSAMSVAAAFTAAIAVMPDAARAAIVDVTPTDAIVASATPLQPSAATLARVQQLTDPVARPKVPWGEVWVEYGPFLEIQPH